MDGGIESIFAQLRHGFTSGTGAELSAVSCRKLCLAFTKLASAVKMHNGHQPDEVDAWGWLQTATVNTSLSPPESEEDRASQLSESTEDSGWQRDLSNVLVQLDRL